MSDDKHVTRADSVAYPTSSIIGMTKREEFAKAAMAALLTQGQAPQAAAISAVRAADLLIAALNGRVIE